MSDYYEYETKLNVICISEFVIDKSINISSIIIFEKGKSYKATRTFQYDNELRYWIDIPHVNINEFDFNKHFMEKSELRNIIVDKIIGE